MDKQVYELKINEALANAIPPLQEMELNLLKDSLVSDGCRDPLVVWKGVIVDGHNRYRLCRDNNIPFSYVEKEFDDESAARLWIIRNQLARRNVPDFVRCELVLPLEAELKKDAEKHRRAKIAEYQRTGQTNQNSDSSKKTSLQSAAEAAGVSHDTLWKAKRIINSADEKTLEQLRSGEKTIHKVYTELKDRTQSTKKKPDKKPTDNPAPQQEKPSKPKKLSALLEKPTIADPTQRERIDGTIVFNPVVNDKCVSTVEQLQEMADDFLEELNEVLESASGTDAEKLLSVIQKMTDTAVSSIRELMKDTEEKNNE